MSRIDSVHHRSTVSRERHQMATELWVKVGCANIGALALLAAIMTVIG